MGWCSVTKIKKKDTYFSFTCPSLLPGKQLRRGSLMSYGEKFTKIDNRTNDSRYIYIYIYTECCSYNLRVAREIIFMNCRESSCHLWEQKRKPLLFLSRLSILVSLFFFFTFTQASRFCNTNVLIGQMKINTKCISFAHWISAVSLCHETKLLYILFLNICAAYYAKQSSSKMIPIDTVVRIHEPLRSWRSFVIVRLRQARKLAAAVRSSNTGSVTYNSSVRKAQRAQSQEMMTRD